MNTPSAKKALKLASKKILPLHRIMELKNILQQYQRDQRTEQIVSSTQIMANARLHLQGLSGAQNAFVAGGVYMAAPQSHLFILSHKEQAAYFQNDLKNILAKKDVLFFPDSFKKPGYFDDVNKSNVLLRTETVSRLVKSYTSGELLVTYPHALVEKVVNTKVLNKNTIHIKMNEGLDVEFMMEILVTYGFEHTDFVYEPGQFSIRGGIVDVYSFGNDLPYRIELFGEEVESIRVFDPLTQLSEKKIKEVTIVPNIQTQFTAQEKTSLFKIISENATVWVQDMAALKGIVNDCYERAVKAAELMQQSDTPIENPIFKDEAVEDNFLQAEALIKGLLNFPIIEFGTSSHFPDAELIEYPSSPQPAFNKNFKLLIKDFSKNTSNRYKNVLFVDSPRQARRFDHIFEDLKAEVHYQPIITSISKGFIDHTQKLVCYTDHQVFDRFYKYKMKQGYSKDKVMTIKMLRGLQPGDYVTHIDHGVGVFSGLCKIEVNGQSQEVIRIVYRDNDILYVNINSLHKVSKYVGKEGKKPKINKIGSDTWEKLKNKTKRKIKDIAKDLIKLYAQRKATKGYAFRPDTYLQTELEASFIYEDTPDQYKATQAIKKDMEQDNPMDRLVCGDVGFGKTEVAIRAAAKAVADGKQVAVLVPTTILAMQHYKTFSDRLANFPCSVDYLNRFKTTKQKKETLEALAAGELDILIGTHAITGKKVKFKDLGLLVIDEEQKFGVAVKEKIRNMKINVDTLTLTATPIPRTLQFSLLNARDLSVMNTPPPNRQPVHTELTQLDDQKIRDAINFEVYRGGQVFFVHNRVKDLPEVTNMIKRLCPDVDVGMAHGQLEGRQLEERMLKFIKHKYDVLVCTNIVEAGLDVPNANTIIINNAHWFGMSDLHQLRGRVGRSNKKAFCYLISPPLYSLPSDSSKRLRTIEQFSDLGSGFQVAMRDLDIRGAGNLLGGEQSGFISDIGYDMYHKILNEAMLELREGEFKDLFKEEMVAKMDFVQDCQIDTDLEMLIPDEYINSTNERLNIYTQLDNIDNNEALRKFGDQLIDRFGPLPKQVKELFNGIKLRWVAKKLGFERIIFKNRKLRCYFISNQSSAYYGTPTFQALLLYVQKNGNKAHFKQTAKHFLVAFDGVRSMKQARNILNGMRTFVEAATAVEQTT